MAVIQLIRHAQASFGARNYDKLSELGEQQATRLGQTLAVVKPALVMSGSMHRHQQTASLAGFTAEVDPGFDEFDHQEVIIAHKPAYKRHAVMVADLARTGEPKRAFQDVFTAATQRWIDGGDGYTESFEAFCERSEAAVRRTAERLGKGETALVFTSGGPIAAVVSRLLSGGDGLWAKLNAVTINTAITKVVSGTSPGSFVPLSPSAQVARAVDGCEGEKGTNDHVRRLTVVSYNEHVHLGAELLTYR